MSQIYRNNIEMVEIERVKPYAQNAKIHSEEQVRKIADQILNFGWDQPIVLEPDMTIIKGHGRLMAAKLLGLDKVPVIVTDLSKAKARAIRLADNKVAEAPWDEDLLKMEMAELSAIDDLDLSWTGFDLTEVDSYIKGLDASNSSDEDSGGAKEISEDSLKNLKYECPRCHFKFDKPSKIEAKEQDKPEVIENLNEVQP